MRGPNVMLGYLNRPDATAETLDADGFLHTGDIGVHHVDGYFTIVDRLKELIKYHGYQIAPAELEALLLSHPKIQDAAVIGVRGDDGEEIPKAFVVAAPDAGLTAEDVMAFVAGQGRAPQEGAAGGVHRRGAQVDVGKDLRKDLRAREAV